MPASLCVHCGFNNPPGMRFCGNCGKKLPVDTSALVASAASREYIPETVGVMMGADLMERFRVAGLNATGQRRTVTILFADLSGFTVLSRSVDTEEVFLIIQQFMNLLIKDVYKYDGMVDKMLGDGLMAIFGAPIAHEDHPELAIRAAADMMEDVRKFNHQIHEIHRDKIPKDLQLSMHIALHSGEVIVGGIGSNMLMNYTAIGDTVNLTSRLLDAANPGVILVSETCFQRVQKIAEFQPAGPFWLKGYDQPVSAYQFVGLLEGDLSARQLRMIRSPIVGRENQLSGIIKQMSDVQAESKGRMIFLHGEAGIGKSRLISEIRTTLIEKNIISITGHCFTYKKSIQYWVLQDMLRHFLNLTGNESRAEQMRIISTHIRNLPNQNKPDTVQLLLWMLGTLPQAEFQKTAVSLLDPEQLQREVFLTVRDILFQTAADRPIALIFEDMHWADESSLQFLAFISRKLIDLPILVIVATRTIADENFVNLIKVAGVELGNRISHVPLRRLDDPSSRTLVQNLLHPHMIPEGIIKRLVDLGNGNPFFLEELVRIIIEQGLVHHEEGWRSTEEEMEEFSLKIPDTIQGLILSRFDRLSAVQRRLLQIASIIGRDFNSNLLREVLKISDPILFEDILQQLVERGILERFSDFKGQDFRFTHILMSDTIYSSLLSGDKSELHGLIAQSIENLYQNRIEEFIDVLARHFTYSNDRAKALKYCIRAGNLSADKFAVEQARKYFSQAEALMATVPHQHFQAAEVYSGLGNMQVFKGEYTQALESYRKATNRLAETECGTPEYLHLSRLHRLTAEVYEKLGQYPEAITFLNQADKLLKQAGDSDPMESIWQLHDLGWIKFRQGDLDGAEATLMEGIEKLQEDAQPALFASLCNRIAGVYYQQSRFRNSAEYLQRSILIREKIGDKVAVSRSSNNLGLLQWKMGDWEAASASFQRSLQSHQQLGDIEGEVNVRANLGLLWMDRGDLPESQFQLTTALSLAEKLNLTYHTAMNHLHLSKLYYLKGEFEKGLEATQKGSTLFAEINAQEILPDLKVSEGLNWLGKGDLIKAKRSAQDAVSLADEVNTANRITDDRGRAYRLLAEVAYQENDIDQAASNLLLADDIFKHTGDELEQARNLVLNAAISERLNDSVTANNYRRLAREIFTRHGAEIDLKLMDAKK